MRITILRPKTYVAPVLSARAETAAATPPPVPPQKKNAPSSTAISLSPLDEANLTHALRRKGVRLSKHATDERANHDFADVVGGTSKPVQDRPAPGPIV